MSDWRQIQARIRKARTSEDPPGQLAALYERTHDAMVAFELAQLHEKSGAQSDAAHWYTAAAERFRRAQWKQKAVDALVRLGAPIPIVPAAASPTEAHVEETIFSPLAPVIAEISDEQAPETPAAQDGGEQGSVFEQAAAVTPPAPGEEASPAHRRKRRGRRGGRGRHKRQPAAGQSAAAPAAAAGAPLPAEAATAQHPEPQYEPRAEPRSERRAEPVARPYESEDLTERAAPEPEPVSAFESAASSPSPVFRTRAGDPALSSRLAHFESQLRRLLACALHPLDQAEDAPAGPGVFVITDTDQTCYYYVEACQTLRVGIGNLLRSGRGSREGANLKEKLADHLGINEARVGKYLKEHCVVRWLQLDEGAPLLAHFVIAVLRPVVNE